MNIFFLHKFPPKAAEYLCDKHVPKMLLESCQMLSTAVHQHKENIPWPLPIYRHHPVWKNVDNLYKKAYPNHPMTKWVALNRGNFKWTLENAVFIGQEYYKRFNKYHKSRRIITLILQNNYMDCIPEGDFTEPPQCMPDEYRDKDYVTAYRRYYNTDKKYFAKWNKGRKQPKWWVQ